MICLNCGKDYQSVQSKSKYCSRKCQCQHRKKTYKISETCICKYCGNEFNPKGYDRTTYCSRECAYTDRKAKPKEKEIKPLIKCIICGNEFEGAGKYCSDECRKEKAKQNYRINKKEKYIPKPKTTKICDHCKTQYKTNRQASKYCSDKCSKSAWYVSETKKEERRRYRARKANAYVAPVNTIEIYKRDKGICQICNKKVNSKLVYPHPLSISLDHIIPLSQGGTHEPRNVQLAHFKCNSVKSDGVICVGEQLRLC